jgi:hypothetical protein
VNGHCTVAHSVCFYWLGDHGTCKPCGGIGQPSCPGPQGVGGSDGSCDEGLITRNRTCVPCGRSGQPCCKNGCVSGTCSAEANYTCSCGDEGLAPCENMTCHGDLHVNLDPNRSSLICTSTCGHVHQLACRTQYPVPGGVSSRYRCFVHSMLNATPGPPIAENCLCVPNSQNTRETYISDNSGFCISTMPGGTDQPDPPDCERINCIPSPLSP